MLTLHGIEDQIKYDQIKASLEVDGWLGAPLVVVGGDTLLTGTHRYHAARDLGWLDYQIPTIELAEVFEEAGLDYEEVASEYDEPLLYSPDFADMVNCELPEEILVKYGIQVG